MGALAGAVMQSFEDIGTPLPDRGEDAPFHGAKAALICGDGVVTIQRDNKPGLAFAGLWEFPGGGREGQETPRETVSREIGEELGVAIAPDRYSHELAYQRADGVVIWFLVAEVLPAEVAAMTLGDEGQDWGLMPIKDFLAREDAVRPLQLRLAAYLDR